MLIFNIVIWFISRQNESDLRIAVVWIPWLFFTRTKYRKDEQFYHLQPKCDPKYKSPFDKQWLQRKENETREKKNKITNNQDDNFHFPAIISILFTSPVKSGSHIQRINDAKLHREFFNFVGKITLFNECLKWSV